MGPMVMAQVQAATGAYAVLAVTATGGLARVTDPAELDRLLAGAPTITASACRIRTRRCRGI
jgi:hypothetical protein